MFLLYQLRGCDCLEKKKEQKERQKRNGELNRVVWEH